MELVRHAVMAVAIADRVGVARAAVAALTVAAGDVARAGKVVIREA
jgi:hypothetical protein